MGDFSVLLNTTTTATTLTPSYGFTFPPITTTPKSTTIEPVNNCGNSVTNQLFGNTYSYEDSESTTSVEFHSGCTLAYSFDGDTFTLGFRMSANHEIFFDDPDLDPGWQGIAWFTYDPSSDTIYDIFGSPLVTSTGTDPPLEDCGNAVTNLLVGRSYSYSSSIYSSYVTFHSECRLTWRLSYEGKTNEVTLDYRMETTGDIYFTMPDLDPVLQGVIFTYNEYNDSLYDMFGSVLVRSRQLRAHIKAARVIGNMQKSPRRMNVPSQAQVAEMLNRRYGPRSLGEADKSLKQLVSTIQKLKPRKLSLLL